MIINHSITFEEAAKVEFKPLERLDVVDVSRSIYQQLLSIKADVIYDVPKTDVVVVVTKRAVAIVQISNGLCAEMVDVFETVSVDEKVEYCQVDKHTVYLRVGGSRPVSITVIPQFC